MQHSYPQAKYVCAYECGKFGYWIQREFQELGIECLVVNPEAAIVKVARKLLSRIRYVWLSGEPYQAAVVK